MKALIILSLFLVGCGEREVGAPVVATAHNGCTTQDHGNGIYFFYCRDGFGHALAEFRPRHAKISSIASENIHGVGTIGYWVVTE